MKKIVLSLAGVLAATAFAPEAAAVPSFARQTGMACNSCHFNSYPALTSFGRAFKSGGYTMIGAQAKVEGDHGLSLPATLNASVYVQMRYNKTNGSRNNTALASAGSKNAGRFDMPDEMALFVGGRVSENIGVVAEIGLNGAAAPALTCGPAVAGVAPACTAAAPPGLVPNFKMPFVFDAGGVKLSLIPFWSNAGASGGFDQFGTGSYGPGRVTENGQGYSATMYMGATNNPTSSAGYASGLALVASNENFHVNLSPYAGTGPTAPGGSNTAKFGATYLRAAWTPSYNNWDLGIGIQNWSGKPSKGTALAYEEARLTVIDGQAQGEVSGMPLGVYASYGTAPATAAAALLAANGAGQNIYNYGPNRKTSFGMLADLWVMPGTLGIQAGFMRAKTGMNRQAIAGQSESDNSYTIGARYKVRQNVKLGLAYTKFSGNAYEDGGSGGTNQDDTSNIMRAPVAAAGTAASMASVNRRGNNRLTLILSAGF